MRREPLRVLIEVPRGGRVKRRANGRLDYLSPWASPFNYGCAPGSAGGDGDPLDVVVLGPALPRGHEGTWTAWAVVRFRDAGRVDDKVVCAEAPPTPEERAAVERFFHRYAWLKGALNRLRLARGRTAFLGWEDLGPAAG